ncbi:MAG: YabP/YqfC family sporulation protein [Clostridia bacterium]|nr:YabP/YqfC family sporulation protein [Clostridia bacterium]
MNGTVRIIFTREGLIAENTDGVASFSAAGLTLRADGGAVSVEGESLVIVSMEDGTVTVSGKIRSVCFM